MALTDTLRFNVTVQEALPLQAPLHPANVEFAPGVAMSVTWVPVLNGAWQVDPQLIPEGLLIMVPVPLPDL